MIVSATSTPTGIPSLGCGEEGNFSANSTAGIQRGCENSWAVGQLSRVTAHLGSSMVPGGPGARFLSGETALLPGPLCSALPCTGLHRAPLLRDIFRLSVPLPAPAPAPAHCSCSYSPTQGNNTVPSWVERENVLSEPEGSCLVYTEVPGS